MRRSRKKLLIIAIVMFVLAFLAVVAFMLTNGKDALSEQVNNLLNKKEETYEESRVRHPNITRLDVDVYGDKYSLKDGNIYLDGKDITKNIYDLNYKPNSLAIIGEYMYVQNKLGLIKIDRENPEVHYNLFHDVYDFVAVGKDYLYVVQDGVISKVNSMGELVPTDMFATGKLYEIFGSKFIYDSGPAIKVLDMTDETLQTLSFEGELKSYSLEEGILAVKTDREELEVDLNDK